MKRAIILARVSTLRQEKEGLSLEDIQLPKLREYAKNNELEVVQDYVFSESADRKIRKKFDEVIEFAKNPKNDITAIIGFRVDRITRNYRDAVAMDDLRVDYGKELHFVDDRLVLTKNSFGRDIQDWDLKVFLAKQTINRLKEDAHNTIFAKISNGEIHGPAPYGYKNVTLDNKKKWVEPETVKSMYVKQVYAWYLTRTMSMEQIKVKFKEDYNYTISKTGIETILCNPFYYGMMRTESGLYPHRYETLVTEEQFMEVQRIRFGFQKKKYKYAGLSYIYRGLFTCHICGCTMTPEKKVKKSGITYHYYHCTGYKGNHHLEWIEEKEITAEIAGILKRMQIPEDVLEWLQQSLKESHADKITFIQNLFDEYTREYNKYEKRIEEAYKDKLDGRITLDMYDKIYKDSRREQDVFKAKLNSLQKADEEYYISASYVLELASKAYELFQSSEMDEKREIVQLLFQNPTFEGKKLHYDLQKPFDKVLEKADRSEWLLG